VTRFGTFYDFVNIRLRKITANEKIAGNDSILLMLREKPSLIYLFNYLFDHVNNRQGFRVRAKISSQILSVEAPAWQGAKVQEYQAYSELSQHRQAGCIGA
jgi:hypothetical protein